MEEISAQTSLFNRKDYKHLKATFSNELKPREFTYDIECTIGFFCVVFKHKDEYNIFVINDHTNDCIELIEFLTTQVTYLKGYNNLAYDSQLLEFIIKNRYVNTSMLYKFSQEVIDAEFPIFNINKLTVFNLDIYKILHLDNKNRMVGLKWCEYMLDWSNVEDMPYHHSQYLNLSQQEETIKYCINDVEATEFIFNKNEHELSIRKELSRKFNTNFANSSYSKLGSELLLKLYCEASGKDPYTVRKMRTRRDKIQLNDILVPYIKFDSKPFNELLKQIKKTVIYINEKDQFAHSVIYKDFQFDYGLGGIHGSLSNIIVEADDNYIIEDADVNSLYPSFAIANGLFAEHLGIEFFNVYDKNIVAVRLAEKAKGDKGDKVIVAGFKEAANSAYGCKYLLKYNTAP